MNRLSNLFSIFLGISMACLLMGLLSKSDFLMGAGLITLISIPIFRAVYAILWFKKLKNHQGMMFSLAVIAALMLAIFLGILHQ